MGIRILSIISNCRWCFGLLVCK